MTKLRQLHTRAQALAQSSSLDDRRLARHWFLKRLRWAREHGERDIRLSLAVCEALRPSIVSGLGERQPQERAAS